MRLSPCCAANGRPPVTGGVIYEDISQLTPSRSSYLTKFGRDVIATVLKLKQQLIVPDLYQFAT